MYRFGAGVLGNGMTAALAFEAAANDIRLGKSRVALALGVNFETATPAVEHMMNSMRATGDVDFHAPFGFMPISCYAMDAARYIHEFKSWREDLASVSVKNGGTPRSIRWRSFANRSRWTMCWRRSRSWSRSGSTKCRRGVTARPALCWSTRTSQGRPGSLTSACAAGDFSTKAPTRSTNSAKAVLPACWSKRITWVPLSGRGKLYS
jgi:hypothetical protein